MKATDLISNATILKIAVAVTASVIVLFLLMKSDHQNFSYELNQPWRDLYCRAYAVRRRSHA